MRRNIVKRTDRKKGKIKPSVRTYIMYILNTRILYLGTACNQ